MKPPKGNTHGAKVYYQQDQFDNVVPYLSKLTQPKWLIIGGPADGNEAQRASQWWPWIKVVGVEPVLEHIKFQLNHGWRAEWPLVNLALSDRCGTDELSTNPDNPRAHRLGGPTAWESCTVTTTTIDQLDKDLGPFDTCVLWLDIEGAEYAALCGARNLLASGRVLLVNVEVQDRLPDDAARCDNLLKEYDLIQAGYWYYVKGHQDRVYIPLRGKSGLKVWGKGRYCK